MTLPSLATLVAHHCSSLALWSLVQRWYTVPWIKDQDQDQDQVNEQEKDECCFYNTDTLSPGLLGTIIWHKKRMRKKIFWGSRSGLQSQYMGLYEDLVLKGKDTSPAGRILGADGRHKTLLSHGKLPFISPAFVGTNYCWKNRRKTKSRRRGNKNHPTLPLHPTEHLLRLNLKHCWQTCNAWVHLRGRGLEHGWD